MSGLGAPGDVKRRGMENAFKAEQRNQRESAQLLMRQHSLDKQKVKCRYLAGKRKRQIEAGIHQLFVTSGHSPQALPPDGPRDNSYKNSPYFSSTATSKIDEKKLLKWRIKERQFERALQEENENMSPWDRQEKNEDTRRVWNQISYIVENSHKGQDLYVDGKTKSNLPEPEANASPKDDVVNQKYGRMDSTNSLLGTRPKSRLTNGEDENLSTKDIHVIGFHRRKLQPLDVFAELHIDLQEKSDNEGMTMSKFTELSKPKPFSYKCWESHIIQNYTSAVTRQVKSAAIRSRQHGNVSKASKLKEGTPQVFEGNDTTESSSYKRTTRAAWENNDQSNSDKVIDTTAASGCITRYVKGRSPATGSNSSHVPTVSKRLVRPLSANGCNKRKVVENKKRIKSAGTLRSTIRLTSQSDTTVDGEINEQQKWSSEEINKVIRIPKLSDTVDGRNDDRRLSSVTEISDFERTEPQHHSDECSKPSEDNAFHEHENNQNIDPEKLKKSKMLQSQNCSNLKRKSSAKVRKGRLQSTSNKSKSQDMSLASTLTRKQEEAKNGNTKKKKKIVTKIKELADLYEDELSDSESDDLEQEALGVSERISQWRRDLMREAPPGIYSVNAPVKIRLAVSKAQLQKDYDRLVEEHSSDLREITEKERVRRLRSRMGVYMTMKIVEKAVNEDTGPHFEL